MQSVRHFLCGLFFLSVSAAGFSASVSIFMCQKDGGSENLRGSTMMIENGVLDTLFERGHIVSSEKTALAGFDADEVQAKALKNGAEGFFDFVVQITVNYKSGISENPEPIIFDDIQSIDWRLMRIRGNKRISEKSDIIPKRFEHENDMQALERFARELGSAVANVIQGIR